MPKKKRNNLSSHNDAKRSGTLEELKLLRDSVGNLNKEINRLEHSVKRKKDKIALLHKEEVELNKVSSNFSFVISPSTAKRRKRIPTCTTIPPRSKQRRRNETYFIASRIHGASSTNKKPLIVGLLDALVAKSSSVELATEIMNSKPALTNRINKMVICNQWKNYQNSSPNMMRSLNVYYSHHVMGKRKYISIRQANKVTGKSNFISYKNLSQFIRGIDIGVVHDLKTLDPSVEADGCYRDIKGYCLKLAKLYLTLNEKRLDKLVYPLSGVKNPDSKVFLIAIGGDGAPLVGTTFLLSFVNVSRRIASSYENFLIFGTGAEETSPVVGLYVRKLIEDIMYLESKVFEIDANGERHKIEFKLVMLPNDMKFLSFLAGELTNNATYFTTFANVSKFKAIDHKKEFSLDGTENFQPFKYADRLEHAELVAEKKVELQRVYSISTQRSHLTFYIASLKSRQEFVPLLGPYVDLARCEPLHLKNNYKLFMKLVNVVTSEASIANNLNYKNIDDNNILKKFLCFVKSIMNCNQLARRLIQWVNDSKKGLTASSFTFRFRGHESYHFIRKFQLLISELMKWTKSRYHLRLMEIFYQSLAQREIISLSTRIVDFDDDYITDMEVAGRKLFCSFSVHDATITPSSWVLCNVAPVHAADILDKYGFGLGINTMEGREQKHQQIKKYADNTTVQNRWEYIFRHEYIRTVFLRENGSDDIRYKKREDLTNQR